MTDYNDLITRLRSMDGIGDIQLNELMNRKTPMAAADAIAELVARVAYLESRLEVAPEHDIDGIAARDATIKLQDGRIAELEAERNIWRDKYMTQAGQLDLLKEAATFLASERAERERQEPVAWYIDGEDGREYNGTPKMSGGRIGTPLYAAPPVITQHEPVTTVEDRYNADGKSCHITDDLPAGMKLYARPIHAEPVNARLLRLIKKARISIFDGLETPCELEHPASIDDRMLVTEIDSAIADAEAQQAGPVRLTEKYQDNLSIPYVGMGGVENYRAYARAIESAVLRANGFKLEGEQ